MLSQLFIIISTLFIFHHPIECKNVNPTLVISFGGLGADKLNKYIIDYVNCNFNLIRKRGFMVLEIVLTSF
jgi:hypothetical protein